MHKCGLPKGASGPNAFGPQTMKAPVNPLIQPPSLILYLRYIGHFCRFKSDTKFGANAGQTVACCLCSMGNSVSYNICTVRSTMETKENPLKLIFMGISTDFTHISIRALNSGESPENILNTWTQMSQRVGDISNSQQTLNRKNEKEEYKYRRVKKRKHTCGRHGQNLKRQQELRAFGDEGWCQC